MSVGIKLSQSNNSCLTLDVVTNPFFELGTFISLEKPLNNILLNFKQFHIRLYSMMLSIRYVVCPSDKRFLLLFTFLKKNRNKKVMVFFSSCMSVKFHHELLNYIDLACMSIHGKQKQTKRTTTFFQYCNADSGTSIFD